MPPLSNTILSRGLPCALSLACCVVATASGAADEVREAVDARWLAAIGFTGGITIEDHEGSLSSAIESGQVVWTAPPEPGFRFEDALRPSASDSDLAVSPYAGGQLELMTPALLQVPGNPRFFVRGEYLPTFAVERNVAKEGDAGAFEFPSLAPGTEPWDPCPQACTVWAETFPEEAILGDGSKTTAQVQRDVFAADIGLAFPFTFLERGMRLKPSFGWINFEVSVEGRVRRAIKNDPPEITFGNPPGDEIRFVDVSGAESPRFNAIGGGLELEMELPRFGPLGPTLFLGGHVYRVIGDRDVEVNGSTSIQTGTTPIDQTFAPDTYTARWTFEADPWVYRAGLGIRIWWIGD